MPLAGCIEIAAHIRDAPNLVCSLGKIPPSGGMRIPRPKIDKLACRAQGNDEKAREFRLFYALWSRTALTAIQAVIHFRACSSPFPRPDK